MKKLICLLLIIIAVILGYAYFNKTTTADKVIEQKQQELQSLIDKNQQEVQEEKMRKLEIQTLQNPEIINSEMTKVGKLIVFESNITYADVLRKKTFWGTKELNIDLKYKYGISYDLTNIIVDRFEDKIVYIKLSKYDLNLEYIDEDNENSIINSDTSWFASAFDVEVVDAVRDNAKIKLTEYINNYQEAYDNSMSNLEDNLRRLILKLGYSDVQFINE